MPLVRARVNIARFGSLHDLKLACYEIVPAGLNSPDGPLTPGSIRFHTEEVRGTDHQSEHVFLDIEAYDIADRGNVEERSEQIKLALAKLFPHNTIAVWLKLVKSGWCSDVSDPDVEADMSMT